jgi:hypothetical protein
MAERLVLVCDVCGLPASETVAIRVGDKNRLKDLCSEHLAELLVGARAARPGRRRTMGAEAGSAKPASVRTRRPTKPHAASSTEPKHRRSRKDKVAASA